MWAKYTCPYYIGDYVMEPRFRSRSFKRIKRSLPGGSNVIHYRRKGVSKAHCASCGTVLPAVPTGKDAQIAKLAKTEKRPERPFGGVLCSKCARENIKVKARV
ncbi:MAG: 50S ribosomal protein L34e [Candidatus Aenigmarchaeota archaeon]|nr:50S ribosomal protein L34e [Candidatus Aenigmarchaeota archaeon]